MESKKTKTKETKLRLIDTENRLVADRGVRIWRFEMDASYEISQGDVIHSMGNIVTNLVLTF